MVEQFRKFNSQHSVGSWQGDLCRGPCLTYQYQKTKILITYSLLVVQKCGFSHFDTITWSIGSMHSLYAREYQFIYDGNAFGPFCSNYDNKEMHGITINVTTMKQSTTHWNISSMCFFNDEGRSETTGKTLRGNWNQNIYAENHFCLGLSAKAT